MFGQSLLSAFGSAACTTDTDQLFATDVQTTSVATYQFNNATTSIPSNTYPGAASNITYATGKFGDAAVFNGSSSFVTLPDSSSISQINNFSWSFWVKPNGFVTYGTIATFYSDYRNYVDIRTGGILGFQTTSGNQLNTPTNSITNGVWQHVALTKSSTAGTAIYINGVSVATNPSDTGNATDFTGSNYQQVMGSYSATGSDFFPGSIDQFRIFSSVLPQSAITALYNETTTTATYPYVDYQLANPNSIAYYKMSDATDQFGNYNGTAGNVNFNTEGKFGFAGAFNGSDSYVSLPAGINKNNNFSWSFWINFTSMTQYDTPIGFFMNGCTNFIDMVSVGRLSLYDGNSRLTTPNSTFATGNWYHIVVTKSSTAGRKFYVNGLEVASDSVNTNSGGTTGGRNLFGAYSSGGNPTTAAFALDGKMDQVRIFNSAISAANVTTLYNEIECPAVAVTNAFNTVLYTGNNGTKSITGVGFKPDFTWIKARDYGSNNHALTDSVRGTGSGNGLSSNNTGAEGQYSAAYGYLSAFGTDGFTVQAGSTSPNFVNSSSANYVAWNWKAGGTAVSNTDGTITSQVSANTDAGFSVVSYTGNLQAGASIGHSLGVKPDLIITKSTSNAESWEVWSSALNNGGVGQQLRLNSSNAAFSAADYYSTPDISKFYVGGYTGTNGNGYTYVSYCFTSIPGYSNVGSYIGTGAAGNFQYTGFQPSWLMIKNSTTSGTGWAILDTTRDGTTENGNALFANSSGAEWGPSNTTIDIDFTATGFTIQNNYVVVNGGSDTYIYLAIA